MPFVKPTPDEIRKTARAAVSALEKNNLKACLFGSAACAIYGMENRDPNVSNARQRISCQTEFGPDPMDRTWI
jgi:hypothetical protein